jgi:hypothetical protein
MDSPEPVSRNYTATRVAEERDHLFSSARDHVDCHTIKMTGKYPIASKQARGPQRQIIKFFRADNIVANCCCKQGRKRGSPGPWHMHEHDALFSPGQNLVVYRKVT